MKLLFDGAFGMRVGSLLTRRWRKVDSNFWSLSALMPLALAK
jgi:hypothetical protein